MSVLTAPGAHRSAVTCAGAKLRRRLLASTAASLLLAPAATAQTSISTAVTTGVRTSTAANGAPGSIDVTSSGSVVPTSGTAVTIDSANAVTNEGTVQITDANGAIGIEGTAGAGAVTNSGKIVVDESYTATDTNADGVLDGPFAQGNNRFGIRTDGAFTGDIANAAAGTITVKGNDSAGIRFGGPLTGSLTNLGTITVLGDRSVGIDAGAINGNPVLGGTVSSTGAGAIGIRLDGPISGALTVKGTITSTGYRSTTLPSSVTTLGPDDLLQGGSAVVIAGDVAGGVSLDASDATPSIHTYAAAPAVVIGAPDYGVTLGAIAGRSDGFGLIVNGTIAGAGVYSGVTGTGMTIGGLGGPVSIAGGMQVTGTIQGSSNGANATGLFVGSGATVPQITVSGGLAAAGGGTAGVVSTALLVDQGATVTALTNAGAISATASDVAGTAVAVQDRAGTIALVTNSGSITAFGATAGSGRNVALDLSANGGGVVVRQSGSTTAVITGDILLSAGSDTLDIQTGGVRGNVQFGAGTDAMSLSGSAFFTGNVDFGAGAKTLSLSGAAAFTGGLADADALAVSVAGGALKLTSPATVSALTVSASGTLGVTLNAATRTTPALTVSGTAAFTAGATLSTAVNTVVGVEGRHIAVSAGTLTGAGGLTIDTSALPFLYTAALATSGNQITVDIARKTATDLGLSRAEAAVYDPAYAALANDAQRAGVFLTLTTGDALKAALAQDVPILSDATFEMTTLGSRTVARIMDDPQGYIREGGRWGYWLAPVGWHSSARAGDTAGYEISGWGVAGGAEIKTHLGSFGAMLAYLDGKDKVPDTSDRVDSAQYQAGGYWRGVFDAFEAKADATYSRVVFDSSRQFIGTDASGSVDRIADGHWNGDLISAGSQASYEMGNRTFFFRPLVTLDYNRLSEAAHAETDSGGTGFALAIGSRTSDEAAVTASVAGGFDLFGVSRDWLGRRTGEAWFRLEAEAGRREVAGGALGPTVAQYAGGDAFTLDPNERASGWVGRLRAIGGSSLFRLAGEFGGEERDGRVAVTARANLRVSVF